MTRNQVPNSLKKNLETEEPETVATAPEKPGNNARVARENRVLRLKWVNCNYFYEKMTRMPV